MIGKTFSNVLIAKKTKNMAHIEYGYDVISAGVQLLICALPRLLNQNYLFFFGMAA